MRATLSWPSQEPLLKSMQQRNAVKGYCVAPSPLLIVKITFCTAAVFLVAPCVGAFAGFALNSLGLTSLAKASFLAVTLATLCFGMRWVSSLESQVCQVELRDGFQVIGGKLVKNASPES